MKGNLHVGLAWLVTLASIIILTVVLADRYPEAVRAEAELAFTGNAQTPGIQGDLQQIVANAANLSTVAERYLSPDDSLLTELAARRLTLTTVTTPAEQALAEQQLLAAAGLLHAQLGKQALSERDAAYRVECYANMQSYSAIIAASPYNTLAGQFNEMLSNVPLRFFTRLEPLQLYAVH